MTFSQRHFDYKEKFSLIEDLVRRQGIVNHLMSESVDGLILSAGPRCGGDKMMEQV